MSSRSGVAAPPTAISITSAPLATIAPQPTAMSVAVGATQPAATSDAQPTSAPAATAIPSATSQPEPTAAPSPTVALLTEAPTFVEYTVQQGDILYTIARDHDVTIDDILAINQIPNPSSLTVGQIIRIPTS
jgi:LysM repeat protein